MYTLPRFATRDHESLVYPIAPENRYTLHAHPGSMPEVQVRDYGVLSEVIFRRTYSRLRDDGAYETWQNTVDRTVCGAMSVYQQHLANVGLMAEPGQVHAYARAMRHHFSNKYSLPPGRGLWAMGTRAVEVRGSAPLNNCGFVSTATMDVDPVYPFVFMFDFSLLGVGVGFDTRGSRCAVGIRQAQSGNDTWFVEDTREGWVETVGSLLHGYLVSGIVPRCYDYSRVRPAGAPLRTFGGVASGPAPLVALMARLRTYFDARIGRPMGQTEIVDVMNMIGVCTISGDIRRSSQIALGDNNPEFLGLKDPSVLRRLRQNGQHDLADAHPISTHRWASNNSINADDVLSFDSLTELNAVDGDPGYTWLDTMRAYGRIIDGRRYSDRRVMGVNPCGEQPLEDGELCCLAEVFPIRHLSDGEFDTISFRASLLSAYRYAKIVTLIPTHNARVNAIIQRNRRLGVGLAGVWELYERVGARRLREILNDGYRYLRLVDREFSEELGVPRSIKLTTIKPGGTVPLVAGCEGGMRVPSFNAGYRTVRFSVSSPIVRALIAAHYRVEPAVTDPATVVVYFPIFNHGVRVARDVTVWEQAELAALLQTYWSDNGVSSTLTFKPEETGQLSALLGIFSDRFKGVSLLPLNDHGYAQAPYIEAPAAEVIAYAVHLDPVNLDVAVHEIDDKGCSSGMCERPTAMETAQPASPTQQVQS